MFKLRTTALALAISGLGSFAGVSTSPTVAEAVRGRYTAPCAPQLPLRSLHETGEGIGPSEISLPAHGLARAALLFVDFPDAPRSESTRRLAQRFVTHAERWFNEVSGGRFRLRIGAVHRWYRLARPSRAYGMADGATFDEQRALMAEAIRAADADVDFAGYELVYVVSSRRAAFPTSPAFHARAGSGITVDGSEIRFGATLGENNRVPLGPTWPANVLLHETAHVLGLPDLYDVPNASSPSYIRWAGFWDLMSSNRFSPQLLAWHKWKLGWLGADQLACVQPGGSATLTVTPSSRSGGLKAIVVPTGATTAYVVEARRRSGLDAPLCETGVLVYSVDSSVASGDGPVRVRRAQPDRNADEAHVCGSAYNATFDRARGEVAGFRDPRAGLSVVVLGSNRAGYRVRVTRR